MSWQHISVTFDPKSSEKYRRNIVCKINSFTLVLRRCNWTRRLLLRWSFWLLRWMTRLSLHNFEYSSSSWILMREMDTDDLGFWSLECQGSLSFTCVGYFCLSDLFCQCCFGCFVVWSILTVWFVAVTVFSPMWIVWVGSTVWTNLLD